MDWSLCLLSCLCYLQVPQVRPRCWPLVPERAEDHASGRRVCAVADSGWFGCLAVVAGEWLTRVCCLVCRRRSCASPRNTLYHCVPDCIVLLAEIRLSVLLTRTWRLSAGSWTACDIHFLTRGTRSRFLICGWPLSCSTITPSTQYRQI